MLHTWTSARYSIPLPSGHRFPIEKYALVRDRVLAESIVPASHLHEPDRARREQLLLVHSADYVDRVITGNLTESEIRQIGFPWSEHLVERSHRAVAGTCGAIDHALAHGIAINLAGGTHHAFPDHGEGFCVFNDVAIGIRVQQAAGAIKRAAIIDLDVHQGNGTHQCFAADPSVFTFSMHGARNYPFRKVAGDLDIGLADGTGDDEYLALLTEALPKVLTAASPDLVVYLAGVDTHEGDRLGRLNMTFDGIARRDHMVLQACRDVGIPVAITIAGGYGRDVATTVEAHVRTVQAARAYC